MHLEESQVVADDEFFLQNAMPIKRRFCQRLSLLLYHRQQNIFDKINAITDCRSKKGRYCGHDFLVRFNIDHIAAVTDCGINISFRMHAPPKIAVGHSAESAAFNPARGNHFFEPIGRNDLPSVPCAVLQAELTELCHICGAQAQPVAWSCKPLRVGKPHILSRCLVRYEQLMLLRGSGVSVLVFGNSRCLPLTFILVSSFTPLSIISRRHRSSCAL